VRLVDFGYASLVGNIPEALSYLQRSTTRPGAVRWAAPEQLVQNVQFSRTTKSDVYSFGCIALQVLTGKMPWSEIQGDIAVTLRLLEGHNPGRPPSPPVDDSHWGLIQGCWSPVAERPSMEEMIPTIQQFLNQCPPAELLRDLLASTFEPPPTRSQDPLMYMLRVLDDFKDSYGRL